MALAPLACIGHAQLPDAPAAPASAATTTAVPAAALASPKAVCPPGIIHWWEPNVAKGVALDIVSGRQGAPRGGATLAPGKTSSSAFALDGADDHVEILGMQVKGLEPRQFFTVAAWVKTPKVGRLRAIVGKISAQEPRAGYLLSIDEGNRPRCELGVDSKARRFATVLTLTPIADDDWHHVACTYNGAEVRLFVDGVAQAALPYSGGLGTNEEPLLIGTDSYRLGNRHFQGVIDDVVLFSRALSASDLEQLMKLSPEACQR